MQRIDMEGSSPHFIGCWNIDQNSLCDDLIEFFITRRDSQKPGQSAGGVDHNAKKGV